MAVGALNELWKLDLRASVPSPDVSIIIPAFGQAEATAECLLAVGNSLQMCNVSAEVLLMDDCSPEPLDRFFGSVQGLRLVRNPENLGFLLTCNAGVRLAQGRDLVLLNNDTLPIGRWLDHLVSFRRSNPHALVVGSRLISPDGLLQESGGIIFDDGSGWNFGRGWQWDDPRCTYSREVDYCSGAAILIEGEFARRNGPFDRRYVPAYYEETDLCFEARRQGGSVWVEPRAIVVHLEGLTNGKDTEHGIKAFQVQNAVKFRQKWAYELESQSPNDSALVWQARSRGRKRRIVVFDEEVPAFDRNSGALRMYGILRAMRELGFEVTFCPRNGRRSQPYTSVLESHGIEVLGPYQFYQSYLETIESQIAYVWVSRVTVAEEIYPFLDSTLPNVARIFDTVDIHYLRHSRESELTQSNLNVERIRDSELGVCARSNAVVAVSDLERLELSRQIPKATYVVSNIHEVSKKQVDSAPFSKTAVFVGSFRHSPNADGVCWFVSEVMPMILGEFPDFKLLVVGEDPPPSICMLQSASVEILGWVEDLNTLLCTARANVAPLRFGAGVKGKISQALSVGLPTVTTSIGAEGMNLVDAVDVRIADKPSDFAEAVIRLFRDDQHWMDLSANGLVACEREFGYERAKRDLKDVLR